ncbi:GPI mannosyltransferase 1-like isoform X1 [Xenia sp. Carnegie-2017]|uniref:GPI mannosyltransferase 1-like isoform X1 n=1 Tax=Xenia sp. Carnegie-2017 TaxID=2897299 RepID=UPI001F04D885|nr:GPI mannosyltransferase 1-like isoform X1 [Xenia sp. Carnegie-2017]
MAIICLDLKTTCIVSFLLRILFMFFGEWQDATMVLKYTDIDYEVFTDAARHVTMGNSPYARATYRYTPLLAWILVSNITIHKAFGKLVFVVCDILAGYLIVLILKSQGNAEFRAVKYSWLWFFNPLTITVSTRGNAESVLALLVLATFYFVLKERSNVSAIFFGISVHFKIYPIIYALPLYLTVGWYARGKENTRRQRGNGGWFSCMISYVIHPHQLKYGLISASVFFVMTGSMYFIYGYEFLEHTYIYHLTRKDVKHNFSVYFYMLYLTMDSPFSWLISLLAFLPQFLLVFLFGIKYYKDLPFCCFLQTFAFVSFNKVCTSQYFLWYLSLFPLALPQVKIKNWKYIMMLSSWGLSQAFWLLAAYLFEFRGYNTLLLVWTASLIFFVVNVWILNTIVVNHISLVKRKST